eukprot:jgi/Ulvmu1/3192/UM015_0233.1
MVGPMGAITATVELIASQHVPVAVKDLRDLSNTAAITAAAELEDIARQMQGLDLGKSVPEDGIADRQEEGGLVERCAQLASVCQEAKAHAPGSGWESPSWQECKIFAHLFSAAAVLLRCSGGNNQERLGNRSLAHQAVHEVDLALMTGCPYQLAEPLLTHASKQMSRLQLGTSDLPCPEADITAWSSTVPEMKAACDDAPIPRIDISHISNFRKEFWKQDQPVIISGALCDWPALDKWKHMQWWNTMHGRRTVPLEVGGYQSPHWHEALSSISEFVASYMIPSIQRDRVASAAGARGGTEPEVLQIASGACKVQTSAGRHAGSSNADAAAAEHQRDQGSRVAYVAQHRIFDQIPQLLEDVSAPRIWSKGYEVMNMWMGTRGTITPLHWDSMDNFFCQVAGAKYVRLYAQNQTPLLYVVRSRAASGSHHRESQGNISSVNVEEPDQIAHPAFVTAKFTHAVLLPGDMLFIPARCWHYVRSLSTSISVNFWF